MNAGERYADAAVREAREEVGVDIKLTGIIAIRQVLSAHYTHLSFIFMAEPMLNSRPPKALPDFNSKDAAWASIAEIMSDTIRIRDNEPRIYCKYVADGGVVAPLSLLW